MNRRSFLGLGGGACAAGALILDPLGRMLAQSSSGQGPVVDTAAGRVRGVAQPGVQYFKGIPYGASTSGAARFMLPSKPQPWTGVRDATAHGPRAPQPFRPMIPEIGDALTGAGPMSEDCLRLNVWTPSATRGGRRPVMVWLHGGGQRTGSGNSVFYDGTELARAHDVVIVTVTHRLNAFGNLYLAEVLGGQYAQTSNLSMLDIIQALHWVRDNIDAFGGDPGNVTIFGQSGGGGKTALLHGMPAAKGLFHKAIIMSTLADTAITALDPHDANEVADRFLSRIGVTTTNTGKLHTLTQDELLAALTAGVQAGGQAGIASPAADLSLRITPVKDGRTLTVHPFEPVASPLAVGIPVMCGSNETEGVPYGDPEDAFWKSEVTTEAALRARVRQIVGVDDTEADRLIALYRKHRPTDNLGDIALVMAADNSPLRTASYTIAERKFAQGAPVYMYYFQWRSPVRNGKLRSMHGMELPFVFNHPDKIQFMTGTGSDRTALAEKMSGAWAAFARNGNPNHRGLPNWPAFDPTERATMVFGNESRVLNDPYGEERRAMKAIRERRA
jgi:para-nitrobenzyl esterase